MKRNTIQDKIKTFCMFALPGIFFFCAVIIIPFIYGVYLTFTDWDGISITKNLVGMQNYAVVFQDKEFWISLWLTIKYVVITTILVQAVAFLLAYLLTSKIRGQNFFRAGFFTPNLIGGIVLGFIWQFLFSSVLTAFGEAAHIPLFSTSWLSDPTKAFFSLVVVTVWQYSGYMMLIYIAGFVGVSRDVLEAASVDGANNFQRTRHIIIPLMRNSFTICTFLTLTRCFMVYDLNISLTEGDPFGSTIMAAMYVYQKAFKSQEYGVGQAEAIILFVVVAVIAVAQFYLSKKKEVEA